MSPEAMLPICFSIKKLLTSASPRFIPLQFSFNEAEAPRLKLHWHLFLFRPPKSEQQKQYRPREVMRGDPASFTHSKQSTTRARLKLHCYSSAASTAGERNSSP